MKFKEVLFKILLVAVVISLTACSAGGDNVLRQILFFNSPGYVKMPTEGPIEMIEGAKDGCRTSSTTRGGPINKNVLGVYMNVGLIKNQLYRNAYSGAYNWCFHKINNNEAYVGMDSRLDSSEITAEWAGVGKPGSNAVAPSISDSINGVQGTSPAEWILGSKGVNMGWGSDSEIGDMFGFFSNCKFC